MFTRIQREKNAKAGQKVKVQVETNKSSKESDLMLVP